MSKYPKRSKHKWIKKPEFKELEIGQNVELNHFIGKAHIASAPSVKGVLMIIVKKLSRT